MGMVRGTGTDTYEVSFNEWASAFQGLSFHICKMRQWGMSTLVKLCPETPWRGFPPAALLLQVSNKQMSKHKTRPSFHEAQHPPGKALSFPFRVRWGQIFLRCNNGAGRW